VRKIVYSKALLALMAVCLSLVAAPLLRADVSDDIWKALINKNITAEKNDGSEVTGKLTSVSDQTIVVIKKDGSVVSVAKADVKEVKVTEAGVQASPAVADVPLGSSYLQLDPLGFLQIGPSVEAGFRVAPLTLIGAAVRLEGLGLLYQGIATQGFQNDASLLSMAIDVMVWQLFPAAGANRWYIGGMVGYGWGSTSGTSYSYGDWKGTNSHIELGVSAGYRWRFPSRFYLDVGGLIGLGIGVTDSFYYTSSPSIVHNNDQQDYFLGALQLHVGWEFN
jgi:small nuclear ribonucleoprotein (snRNP)-like protein